MVRSSRERGQQRGLSTSLFDFKIDTTVVPIVTQCRSGRSVAEVIFEFGRVVLLTNNGKEPAFERAVRIDREGRDNRCECQVDVGRMRKEVRKGFEEKSDEF
jgi:hypothetical protein